MPKTRRVYREIYWSRIVIGITLLSFAVCGVMLYFVFSRAAPGTLIIPPRGFFYVSTGSYDTRSEAIRGAAPLRAMGGAGFILNDGQSFKTIAAVYANGRDAGSVAARLTEEGFSAEVIARETPVLRIPASDAEEAKAFAAFFLEVHELFEAVFRLSVDLDERRIAESHAVLSLTRLRANLVRRLSELGAFEDSFPESASVKALYNALITLFTDAVSFSSAASVQSDIRYLLCGIADGYYKTITFLAEERSGEGRS